MESAMVNMYGFSVGAIQGGKVEPINEEQKEILSKFKESSLPFTKIQTKALAGDGLKIIVDTKISTTWKTKAKKHEGIYLPKYKTIEFKNCRTLHYKNIMGAKVEGDNAIYNILPISPRKSSSFEFFKEIEEIREKTKEDYGGKIIIPFWNFNKTFEAKWCHGMKINRLPVIQASQKNKIDFNNKGAFFESQTLLMTKSMKSKPLVIDKPFIFWVDVEDLAKPIVYGFCDEKDWSRK